MNNLKQKRRKRVVKAWIIADNKSIPIAIGNGIGETLTELFFVYKDKKLAEKAWKGMNILSCTITYSLPNKKIK